MPNNFEIMCKNILALSMAFNWQKVLEWNKYEDDFDHHEEELQVIVTAKGALNQIWNAKKFNPENETWEEWGIKVQKILNKY